MSEGKFLVSRSFIFGDNVRREGSILTIAGDELAAEVEKGVHPKTGRPMSALLNHCEPENEAADEAINTLRAEGAMIPEQPKYPPTKEDDGIESMRKEMDDMGAAYDRRWGLKKLQMELTKAKKIRGL